VSGGGSDANLSLSGASTVSPAGELVLTSGGANGFGQVSGAGTLTNNGTIESSVTSGGSYDLLDVNLDNAVSGKVEVASGDLEQTNATSTTNDGIVITDPGTLYEISQGTFTGESDGTMEFEIAGASNFGSVLVSGSGQFALNGGTVQGALEGGFTPPIPAPDSASSPAPTAERSQPSRADLPRRSARA